MPRRRAPAWTAEVPSLSSRLTLVFASAAHVFAHMFMLFYATVVLTMGPAFDLSYADLQWLSVPGFVLFGAAALPAGWLGDRWSTVGMMAVFFFGLAASSIVTGLATSPLGILIGLSLIGTFASIYHPVGIAWLVRNTTTAGRALGVNAIFGSLGTAAAALTAGALADLISWRAAFILPGVLCAAVGASFVVAVRRGWLVEGAAGTPLTPSVGRFDARRGIIVVLFTTLMVGLIFQSTSVALPKLFSERLPDLVGGGALGAGLLVSLVYVVAALAPVVVGELADRYPLKLVYFLCLIAQAPVLFAAYFMHSIALVGMVVVAVSLNMGGSPAENALVARFTPLAWRSRIYGLKFVLSLGVSTAGVAMVPVMFAATGVLGPMFTLWAGFALAAAAGAWLLPAEPATARAPSVPGAAE